MPDTWPPHHPADRDLTLAARKAAVVASIRRQSPAAPPSAAARLARATPRPLPRRPRRRWTWADWLAMAPVTGAILWVLILLPQAWASARIVAEGAPPW